MTRRYIEAAEFFIEEMKKESLSVVNAAKLANHLNEIRKSINDFYRLYDVRPLSDVELKTKFEDVVHKVVPLIDQAIAAKAKGGSRNKSRSRKHKKSRNHKKSRKHKKSSKKSKRL